MHAHQHIQAAAQALASNLAFASSPNGFYCPADNSALACFGKTGDQILESANSNYESITSDDERLVDLVVMLAIALVFKVQRNQTTAQTSCQNCVQTGCCARCCAHCQLKPSTATAASAPTPPSVIAVPVRLDEILYVACSFVAFPSQYTFATALTRGPVLSQVLFSVQFYFKCKAAHTPREGDADKAARVKSQLTKTSSAA
eukprot:3931538-Pleurochrysis_carterae.AAC.1